MDQVINLSTYRLETLHLHREFILYRCRPRTKAETTPRILALSPVADHPVPATIKRIEHEFSLKDKLDPGWAVRPIALTRQQNRLMLLLEDPQGEPLDRLVGPPMELGQFLRCGIALATATGHVHRCGLIHKDIKPSNVLVNASVDQAWLTGFGIASRLTRERISAEPPELISGTLPYMAPEQTGRMNRSVDSRSDLYALGITLYQLLTGSLPFTASDPMEWIHCHIAKQPLPPAERLNDIPRSVSAIIMKLLAKTPEERYQTAAGVESDLRRCLEDWDHERVVHNFGLGEHDKPDRLLISEKLYGRERQIETLLASFDRVVESGKPELVLVSGYSGIGKSSVVNELHRVLVPPRGLFVSGKFDQYKRDIPYSTLAHILQSLTRRLLAKSEIELATWRDAIREALGANRRLIIDLVPELELIIGEEPPVPNLLPQDSQRRFHLALRRFIGVFARPEHPLALFLDDLQWLDSVTLEALEDLLSQGDVHHLLVIGAYRDNEVDAAHPLMRKVQGIRGTGVNISDVILGPLSSEDVTQLVAEAIQSDPEYVLPLARSVYDSTAGNPFFTIQFLAALEQEGLLTFDHAHGHWSWDLNSIHAKGYTDNVVDLMVGKFRRLSAETQQALQQLACLGNLASVSTLSLAYGTEESQVHSDLFEAVREELVERRESSYKFIHDRIQEAAYSLIPQTQRDEIHLRIGRLLLDRTSPKHWNEALFEIVNHLNRGAGLITSPNEKERLAELNLIAAKRAKASAAYASALTHLVSGAALLAENTWDHHHDLMFAIELNRAECEFVTGQLEQTETRLNALATHALTLIERAAVACLRMDLCLTLDQSCRAIDLGLDYLRNIGIEWSSHPSEEDVRCEYERIWSQLGNRPIEDLIELPVLSDTESFATLDILTRLVPPAYATDNNLHDLVTCRAVNLSLERGNCDSSCLAYVWLGAIAGVRFRNYQAGFRFGRLGCDLVERRGFERFRARTYLSFAAIIGPWTQHLRTGRALSVRAFDTAISAGDPTYAAYSLNSLVANILVAGESLLDVQREAEQGLEFAKKARVSSVIDFLATQLALVRSLLGQAQTFGCLNSANFDELNFECRLAAGHVITLAACWYWTRKLQALFLAGDYTAAVSASLNAQQLLWTSRFFLQSVEAHFYGSLSHAACCDVASPAERHRHLEALALHQRQIDIWAKDFPDNFENCAALVGAEIARIENRELDAGRLYEKAIKSARDNGFVQNEAIAYECASRFYRAQGFDEFATFYLRNARSCYLIWGADGKVRQLDQRYPSLRQEDRTPGHAGAVMTHSEVLDLATVIEVSQAVSGEMVLERLIEKVLCSAIEMAGAMRGLLIVPRGQEFDVQAEATASGDNVNVCLGSRTAVDTALPESLVRYVLRTKDTVILDDASSKNLFCTDLYIVQNRTRSVLCLPLINKGKLTGALYLENSLTSNAFTPNRVTVLKVLASQVAISLENTRLYRDLESREAKIRRLVDANILGIMIANADGVILECNDAFLHTVRYHRDDVISGRLRWTELTPAEWRESDEQAIARGKETGIVEPYEKEFFRRDGSRVPVLIAGARFEEGGNEGVVFVLDITEQKRAEAEIRALKDQLYRENLSLRDEVDRVSMFEEIVGTSTAVQSVLTRVAKVAPTESTVLITGETGTGKELFARAIHKRSRRSGRAFVSANCGALVPSLISSELFGHEKGAFTGAEQRRLGRFELADGGTIFLDEVGDLPIDTQVALLRVLQEREFERLGGGQTIRVDVRVIAATNRDLKAAVANGTFRQDLYYRLNVFPVEVPPLRERKEDILILVEYFVQRYAIRLGKRIKSIDRKTLDILHSYDWPGNIRELQNVIERSMILNISEVFSVDELWFARESTQVVPLVPIVGDSGGGLRGVREVIEAVLAESKGRVSGPFGAAVKLGIPPSTLESRIKALKIRKDDFKFS